MELRHVRYFVAAAEEGHIGRAAHRLRISPQGLGIQIRELEHELGVDLFERLPRGVRLTPAGTTLFGHARRLLADLQAAGLEPASELPAAVPLDSEPTSSLTEKRSTSSRSSSSSSAPPHRST